MRIGIILPATIGGCLFNCINISKALKKMGHTPYLILFQYSYKAKLNLDILSEENIVYTYIDLDLRDNKYYLYKKVSTYIEKQRIEAVILNDAFDHNFIRSYRKDLKVFSILHGDYGYYYDLAVSTSNRIDKFVCVSKSIEKKAKQLLPDREKDIVYIPPATKDTFFSEHHELGSASLSVIFVGRMTEEKGFPQLPQIDAILKDRGLIINWTIVAPKDGNEFDEWLSGSNVTYLNEVSNIEMPKLFKNNDVFILPSLAEGTPLSLIEAMKAGLVPIVSDLSTIATEIVKDKYNGMRIPVSDTAAYADAIEMLNKNRPYCEELAKTSISIAKAQFSEEAITGQWKSVMEFEKSGKQLNVKIEAPLDRLDQPYLPNFLVKTIRSIRLWKSH